MLRKWHRIDDDIVHHDGYIHSGLHSDSPRTHGRESPHHFLHHENDNRGSKELHGIHGLHGLSFHKEQNEQLSSDDQDNSQDNPSAVPLLHFENEKGLCKHTPV